MTFVKNPQRYRRLYFEQCIDWWRYFSVCSHWSTYGDSFELYSYLPITLLVLVSGFWMQNKQTYLLTPWSRVLLEKLTGPQLVKQFSAFYGSRRFTTAPTSDRHLSLYWASSIQSIPPHPTFWRSISILSSHLRQGLPSGLFPSGFPSITLYTPLLSPVRATCPAQLILLDFITRVIYTDHFNNLFFAVRRVLNYHAGLSHLYG